MTDLVHGHYPRTHHFGQIRPSTTDTTDKPQVTATDTTTDTTDTPTTDTTGGVIYPPSSGRPPNP